MERPVAGGAGSRSGDDRIQVVAHLTTPTASTSIGAPGTASRAPRRARPPIVPRRSALLLHLHRRRIADVGHVDVQHGEPRTHSRRLRGSHRGRRRPAAPAPRCLLRRRAVPARSTGRTPATKRRSPLRTASAEWDSAGRTWSWISCRRVIGGPPRSPPPRSSRRDHDAEISTSVSGSGVAEHLLPHRVDERPVMTSVR